MSKFYSPSTRGFYTEENHGKQMPADVVEIPDQEWAALLEAQSQGKTITPDADGRPMAVGPGAEQIATARRRARDQLLTETDWLVARHRDEVNASRKPTLNGPTYTALQDWRQALRDLTKLPDFPNVPFPPRPDGI